MGVFLQSIAATMDHDHCYYQPTLIQFLFNDPGNICSLAAVVPANQHNLDLLQTGLGHHESNILTLLLPVQKEAQYKYHCCMVV